MANRQDRARQFMPFASLKGYFDKILEQQRITEPKKDLSESECERISNEINQVKKGMIVTVTHYDKDCYIKDSGIVSNIDFTFRTLIIVKKQIKFDDIFSVCIVEE